MGAPAEVARYFIADVVRFCPPHGERRNMLILVPWALKENYDEMLASGCRLEAELLSTEELAVSVSNPDVDVHTEIAADTSGVQAAIVVLLAARKWVDQHEENT